MKTIYKFLILAFVASGAMFYSCETTELENLASPNALSPDLADPDLLLNSVQRQYNFSIRTFHANGGDLGRISQMFGRNYLQNFHYLLIANRSLLIVIYY